MIETILYLIGGIFAFYIGVTLFTTAIGFAFGLFEILLSVLYGICYGIYYLIHRFILRRGSMRFNQKRRSNLRSIFGERRSTLGSIFDIRRSKNRSMRRSTLEVGRSIGRSTARDKASRDRPSILSRSFSSMWGKFVDCFREEEK